MTRRLHATFLTLLLSLVPFLSGAFTTVPPKTVRPVQTISRHNNISRNSQKISPTSLNVVQDLDVIALVAGQENYGLAIVLLGEGIWSFSKAPGVDHGIKTLVPAGIAAIVLGAVSGPMITSGDAGSVATGLWIATGISVAMGGAYVARLLAPFSPSPKEIAALGLLVALAGFFSFSQNLIVDGFVTLPSIPLPSLPTIDLPELPF